MQRLRRNAQRTSISSTLTKSSTKVTNMLTKHKKKQTPFYSNKKSRVFACSELLPGDHLSFLPVNYKFIESLHAILVDIIDTKESNHLVLSLCLDFAKHLSSLFDYAEPLQTGKILNVHVNVNFVTIIVYKHLHENINRKEVIERSLQRDDDDSSTDIISFTNKSFVSYCLCGQRGVVVFLDPKKLSLKQIAEIGETQIIGQAAESGAKVGIVLAAKSIEKITSNALIGSLAKGTSKAAGPVIGTAVEATARGLEISKKKKQLERGELTEIAFHSTIAREVTKGTGAVIGGLSGSIIGEIVFPIPILGGIAGGIVGGTVGSIVGSAGGKLIGSVVEKIQTRVKIKQISKSQFYLNEKYKNTVFVICDDSELKSIKEENRIQLIKRMIDNEELEVYEQSEEQIN